MAASAYSWENRLRSFDQEEPRAGEGDVGWDDSEDDTSPAEVTGEAAGDLLLDILLSLHYAGKLSARSLCVICWYAQRSGATGKVGDFGFRPEAPTGHFQRHLDTVTGIDMKSQMSWRYTVDVPQHDKYDASRTSHALAVSVPHEDLNEER